MTDNRPDGAPALLTCKQCRDNSTAYFFSSKGVSALCKRCHVSTDVFATAEEAAKFWNEENKIVPRKSLQDLNIKTK